MRILSLTLIIGCMAVGAVFSACKDDEVTSSTPSDDGGAGTDSPSPTIDGGSSSGDAGPSSACAAIADAQCRRLERCSPLLVHAYIGDLAECTERFTIICERATHAPGASPYSAACLTALDSSCESYDELDACNRAGSLPDGAPCEFAGQCAAGHCGGVGGKDFCGTCKPANSNFDPADASCQNDDCDRGLSCIGFKWDVATGNTLGKCEPTRMLGQPCTDTEDCNSGGRCGGDGCVLGYGFACVDSKCALPLGEGASCSQAFSTGPACDVRKELLCQLAPTGGATCVKIAFSNENQPCRNNEGPGPGSCVGTTRCVGDAGAEKCVRKGVEGAACVQDYDCRFGAACLNNVCTITPADRCK